MQRLRELRLFSNLTQSELAEKISTTQTTIGKYERGELQPSIDTLTKLSDLFACSIDYLIGREDDFGNVTVYTKTDKFDSLSSDEQKIVNILRQSAPFAPVDFVTLYSELPHFLQENIFHELKGMNLAAKTTKKQKKES